MFLICSIFSASNFNGCPPACSKAKTNDVNSCPDGIPAKVMPVGSISRLTSKDGIFLETSVSLFKVIFSDKEVTSSNIPNISWDEALSSTFARSLIGLTSLAM